MQTNTAAATVERPASSCAAGGTPPRRPQPHVSARREPGPRGPPARRLRKPSRSGRCWLTLVVPNAWFSTSALSYV